MGLTVLDGYIACGSETNEVNMFNKKKKVLKSVAQFWIFFIPFDYDHRHFTWFACIYS